MNRRGFLASLLAIPAGLKAALTRAPAQVLTPDDIFIRLSALKQRSLAGHWMQSTRMTSATSLSYEDVLDEIMEGDPVKRRANWHQRRRVRFRESLARQLAMPTPRLP